MSGFHEHEGVVVIAATNRADTLDDALLRAGRFDRQIEVPLPGQAERLQILKVHAEKKAVSPDVSLADLARQTVLFSGAKLECLLNEAAILAVKRNAEHIEQQDLSRAMDAALFGAERMNTAQEHERKMTAAHEAGHAVVTAAGTGRSLLHNAAGQFHTVSVRPNSPGMPDC